MIYKNILVISHPRSGTHFTINSIAENFDYYSNIWLDVCPNVDQDKVCQFFERQIYTPRIHKSHHFPYSFEKCRSILRDKYHVFYVIREGRDTMVSCYEYYANRHRWSKAGSIDEYMSENCTGDRIANRYGRFNYITPIERWISHITEWLTTDIPINIIFYEHLSFRFDDVIKNILSILGMRNSSTIIKPSLKSPGPYHRKGIVGDYKNYFSKSTENLYLFETKEVLDLIKKEKRKIENEFGK